MLLVFSSRCTYRPAVFYSKSRFRFIVASFSVFSFHSYLNNFVVFIPIKTYCNCPGTMPTGGQSSFLFQKTKKKRRILRRTFCERTFFSPPVFISERHKPEVYGITYSESVLRFRRDCYYFSCPTNARQCEGKNVRTIGHVCVRTYGEKKPPPQTRPVGPTDDPLSSTIFVLTARPVLIHLREIGRFNRIK